MGSVQAEKFYHRFKHTADKDFIQDTLDFMGDVSMEYAILDELQELSDRRAEEFMERTKRYFVSRIEEVTESFEGSSPNIRLFIFHNFVTKSDLVDLAVIIREVPNRKDDKTGFMINNVESSIFPIYVKAQQAFDLPTYDDVPKYPEEKVKFIVEKRSLPKKPYDASIPFDPEKHKWTIGMIAEHLHISNRNLAIYCKYNNL